MIIKIIRPFLYIPIAIYITSQKAVLSKNQNTFNTSSEEKVLVKYSEIENLILKNLELQSLQELINSSRYDLSSKVAKRYPTLNLQANGLPKFVTGENYNSNTSKTKTSQFSANPTLNLRWDLIDPLRSSEIKIAKENYKISKNNYEIKKKDLIQEAKVRFHKYQKSFQDIKNVQFALDLSNTSLKNARSKLDTGIGTKFEVLEANAQLARDKQLLKEKKIENEIYKISLKEILNINGNFEINREQKLIGFWDHKLNENIKKALENNLSLKNLSLQKLIKESRANSFLNANRPNIYISNTFSSSFTKGDSLSPIIDHDEYGSSYSNTVSLNFSWNIFNGGQNQNSYQSSKAEARSEIYALDNFKNTLKTNISQAYLNLKLNEEKILATLQEIKSANESLRLTRLRYGVGISTLKDVLVRQKELSNAKSKKINAIYNYNLNLDELERLTFLKLSNDCIPNEKDTICNMSI